MTLLRFRFTSLRKAFVPRTHNAYVNNQATITVENRQGGGANESQRAANPEGLPGGGVKCYMGRPNRAGVRL